MNSKQSLRNLASLTVLTTALAAFAPRAGATPYATELTNVSGTVSFTLNESADNVKIIHSGTTTNDLGALAADSYSTNVSASGTVYIEVTKSSAAGYKTTPAALTASKLQISSDTNKFNRYNSPRGVAVNRNPASPFFGRVYVANSTPGTNSSVADRYTGRGFYSMKSDLSDSPNNYGTNAQTGGLPFASPVAPSANSPFQISMGEDDHIYIADFSDTNGIVARIDGNLQVGELVLDYVGGPTGIQPPTNHGSTKFVRATGSLGGGNLKVYTLDEDYAGDTGGGPVQSPNSFWRYDIDSGPLTNQNPGTFVAYPALSSAGTGWTINGNETFAIGTNGYMYIQQNRSAGAEPGMWVIDVATGNSITNSQDMWSEITGNGLPATNDTMRNIVALNLSPDQHLLALQCAAAPVGGPGSATASDTWLVPIGEDGIFDLTQRRVLDTGAVSQGRGVDFDLAGNIYTVSSGDAVLRVHSPGGYTITRTGNDGTFTLTLPPNTVSLTNGTPVATEAGPVNGVFTVTRAGTDTNALTVNLSISGTASNGVDYSTIVSNITFDVNQYSTNIIVTPIDDSTAEFTETVVISIAAGTYGLGSPTAGTVAIVDNETPELSLTNLHTQMFERTNDYANFRVTRRGDTNVATIAVNLSTSGSATANVDYYVDSATIDPGVVNLTFKAYPIEDAVVETNETITLSLAAGSYTIGSPSAANAVTLVNATLGTESTLFSDNFDTDTTSNWILRFGSTNDFEDYSATFNYDYSAVGIPPAPHSGGDTHGLKMTVHKGSLGSAAGINFYPTNQSFSGNFALRFDMYLIVGAGGLATEYALFGINHSGNKTNWFRDSTAGFGGTPGADYDGLFSIVEADGGNLGTFNSTTTSGDYVLASSPAVTVGTITGPSNYVRRAASTLTGVFKSPPWNFGGAAGGAPANSYTNPAPIWADVELKQLDGVVTLSINRTAILTYTNTTAHTNGDIMLGYDDGFDSVGPADSGVIYDNVRVVRVFAYKIASATVVGSNIQIDFTTDSDADTTASFTLQTSTVAEGPYADASATITQTGAGQFRAVRALGNPTTFYRIKRQ